MPTDRNFQGKTAAFFDVDGTIVDATIVHYYVQFRLRQLSPVLRPFWLIGFIPKIVYYLFLDQMSRTKFNHVFYRNYRGMNAEQVKRLAREMFDDYVRPKIFPAAVERIRRHQKQNDQIVLVTGSLDFIMQPLAEELKIDDVLAVRMGEQGGRLTGDLTTPPLGGEAKAEAIEAFAKQHGIYLPSSHAYGDSRADLPMLRSVGNPVVVNPGKALRRIATESNWEIQDWKLT
jgi:alcohol-forming fatty acyl-CoA reductase